ncbi:phox (px) domain-containing protein [Holotrichia oblita]|uniref:Phox (Px) domain-containing protein n=1 Tax=Holotrichia oblita TaxID=644536 RepID=A0ACB9TD66_HOLOL|nr:phox (px) domain-containing protein [Holotrichia oblita]
MSDSCKYNAKYQQLLRDLKSTVEGLLFSQVANLWSIYGGLNRLHVDIEKIFKHGCKASCENDTSGYWHFIQGLEWLYPDNTKSTLVVDCEYKQNIPQHLKNDKASIWLYRSIENHSLSQKLSWLLSDKTHVLACYQSQAYLCQTKYAEATLICLRAVERNQPSLLMEIDPCLFLNKANDSVYHKIHRRSSSFPDAHFKRLQIKDSKTSSISKDVNDHPPHSKKKIVNSSFKAWSSLPNLSTNHCKVQCNVRSHTNPSTPVHNVRKFHTSSQTKVASNETESKSGAKRDELYDLLPKANMVKHVIINNENIIEHTAPSVSVQQCSSSNADPSQMAWSPTRCLNLGRSAPDYGFLNALAGEKDFKNKPKKTFIEDGGMSVLPMSTGYFPRPVQGQTLTSFLTSSQFTRANAELDRENAHFSISEAMISAMEQIRCKRNLKLADEHAEESDEEINNLKQRIRLRRREKLEEKQKGFLSSASTIDSKNESTLTETSSCSSSVGSCTLSVSSDGVDDIEINEASNLSENCGLSMSMGSLYSEADLLKRPRGAPDGASDILSAEGVALSLISKFTEKQLPRASELEWLVSEEDAPQALLPLPKSWPVNPDDSQDIPVTPLRGTREWAPPRAQLILTLHSAPSRKILMGRQGYRCAGCGMRVAPQYASKFRYCHYLGRYFCTGCHTNQVSLIPARIIHKWDFVRYPVSNFSYRLIEQMYTDPLFRIFEINPNITKRTNNLETVRKYAVGLQYMKDYIMNCRFAEK